MDCGMPTGGIQDNRMRPRQEANGNLDTANSSQKGRIPMIAHAEGHWEQMLFDRLNEEIHRKLPCTIMFVKQESSPVKQSLCLRGDRVQPHEAQ